MEMSKPWKCQNPKQKPSKRNKTSTNCRGNTREELRNKIKMAGMLTEILMARKQPTGFPYPAKVANARTVAKSTHTRAEKRRVLPMKKVVEAVESKTTMKLFVDQRNPTGNKSLKFKSHGTTFKTLLMKTPCSSEDSDEDGYAFSVNSTGKEQSQPMFNIVIHDTPMTIMADSGASVNVLDEKYYQALSKRPGASNNKGEDTSLQVQQVIGSLGKIQDNLEIQHEVRGRYPAGKTTSKQRRNDVRG
jgi:hypothetical protein